jgi:hypothetical protein
MIAHDAQDAALAHHDEDDMPSDEPSTPMWLPLLGGVLLLAGLGAFLVSEPTGKSGQQLSTEAAAAQAQQAGEPQPNAPSAAPAPGGVQAAVAPGGVQARPTPPGPSPAPAGAMPSGGCGM